MLKKGDRIITSFNLVEEVDRGVNTLVPIRFTLYGLGVITEEEESGILVLNIDKLYETKLRKALEDDMNLLEMLNNK